MINDLIDWYYDGAENAEKRRMIFRLIEADPILKDEWFFNRSHHDHLELSMRKIHRIASISRHLSSSSSSSPDLLPLDPPLPFPLSPGDLPLLLRCLAEYDPSFGMRHGTHHLLFLQALRLQASAAQWAAWGPPACAYRMLGCFAMTELGHSSALRRLQTTATYHPPSRSFLLHSPSLQSLKWWIGGAGHSATHAVVIAQLCSPPAGPAPLGLAWFLVPLRDPETGRLLPGVQAAELGPKPGRQGVDNGWIRFSGARVPREAMLCRWMQLSEDGAEFSPPPHPAIPYLSLIPERLVLILGFVQPVSMGLTVALRYARRRLQGIVSPMPESTRPIEFALNSLLLNHNNNNNNNTNNTVQNNHNHNHNEDDEEESPILDYASHYTSLVPPLCQAVVFHACIFMALGDWEAASSTPDDPSFLLALPDYHATSASLKCTVGWWAAESLEAVRRSMGGHAFSLYNNVYQLIADIGVLTTGGGDNAALCSQVIKFLLSSYRQAISYSTKRKTPSSTSPSSSEASPSNSSSHYLFHLAGTSVTPSLDLASLPDDMPQQIALLQCLVFRALAHASRAPIGHPRAPSPFQLWDVVRAHSAVIALTAFLTKLSKLPPDSQLLRPLSEIGCLAGLSFLEKECPGLLLHQLLTPDQCHLLKAAFHDRCFALRDAAVALCDIFDYPDFVLRSPLAIKEGDMYQNYFATVSSAPGATGQPTYWKKYIGSLVSSL